MGFFDQYRRQTPEEKVREQQEMNDTLKKKNEEWIKKLQEDADRKKQKEPAWRMQTPEEILASMLKPLDEESSDTGPVDEELLKKIIQEEETKTDEERRRSIDQITSLTDLINFVDRMTRNEIADAEDKRSFNAMLEVVAYFTRLKRMGRFNDNSIGQFEVQFDELQLTERAKQFGLKEKFSELLRTADFSVPPRPMM